MEIKLGQYKKFGFKRPDVIVNDDEINEYIHKIKESYQKEIEKDGAIESGDYIVIDYNGYHDGIDIPQLSKKSYHSRIGQGFLLEEFEAHLIGKKKGDTVKFELKLPDDYGGNFLCGEIVNFEVKILSVMNKILPELTNDVVKTFKIQCVNNLNELKAYAKDNVYYKKMMVESTNIINEIMKRIIENSEVQLKDEEVNSLSSEIFEDFKKQLEKKNANLQIYLSHANKTEKEILDQCKLEAETYLTEKAIIEKIAEEKKITLSNEEKERYSNYDEEALNQKLYQKAILFLLKENTI